MNSITISFEVKPSLLQEEWAKLYPIKTIKQFKAVTLRLDKLKASMHQELHAAYALEKKIEEAAVLLKRQAIEDQGIYNAHLGTTPMELSDSGTAHTETVPVPRSNQTAPAKRSNQMALSYRCPQTVHTEMVPVPRSNQTALTYGCQQRGSQAVSDGHKTKTGTIFRTWG